MEKRKFKVKGMSCAACVARVEKAVNSLGVDSCEVNLLLGSMSVEGSATDEAIINAVSAAGYSAELYGDEKSLHDKQSDSHAKEEQQEKKSTLYRLVSSSVLLIILMYISMGHVMWNFPLPKFLSENPLAIALSECLLSGLIMVINKHFFVNGVRGLVHLAPNMDTLVSVGSLTSYVYSVVLLFLMSDSIINGNLHSAHSYLHGLYFESAAMILVLITVGKLLESIAKGKTTTAIRALMNLAPKTAIVIRDGNEVEIPAKDIKVGDVFIVKRGVNIAADGIIIDGELSINESALTGESIPVDKGLNDSVFGATTVLSGYAKIKALKVGEETAISEVIKMVKEASGSKAPVAKAADKVAGVFVPFVMCVSLITFVIWMLLDASVAEALSRAVTVLVISCPCALGLATPVAIMVGTGVGAKYGLLFKNAVALEASGKIKVAAFDKTGTITEGKPKVTDVLACSFGREELLKIAYALEEKSEHPLARAITAYAEESNVTSSPCDSFEAMLGGVKGEVSGAIFYAGNKRFIEGETKIRIDEALTSRIEALANEGKTVIIIASVSSILGVMAIADTIREDSALAIAELNSLGVETVMITGDNKRAAEYVAKTVGIKRVVSEVLPSDKANVIKEIKSEGKCVAMVGDGINDAVALTEADVGIAIGRGADVAVDSADVVLKRSELSGVPSVIKLGKKVLFNIYENLFWAFIYNVVGIPLAAGAFISAFGWELQPMFGAAAMSVSSLLVVSNALRLNLYNPNNVNKNYKKAEASEKINTKKEKERMKTLTINIEGMMCPHCSGRVKNALLESNLVKDADVSHERGNAIITLADSDVLEEEIKKELEQIVVNAGYKVI